MNIGSSNSIMYANFNEATNNKGVVSYISTQPQYRSIFYLLKIQHYFPILKKGPFWYTGWHKQQHHDVLDVLFCWWKRCSKGKYWIETKYIWQHTVYRVYNHVPNKIVLKWSISSLICCIYIIKKERKKEKKKERKKEKRIEERERNVCYTNGIYSWQFEYQNSAFCISEKT